MEKLEIRFAFERDLVRRRGYSAFKPSGVLSECIICGGEFDRGSPRGVYCPKCGEMRRKETRLAHYHRRGADNRRERTAEARVVLPTTMEQGWEDLAFAIVERAFADHDYFWLTEFGLEFLAYSGRPQNERKFDSLLEEMVNAKDKQTQENN